MCLFTFNKKYFTNVMPSDIFLSFAAEDLFILPVRNVFTETMFRPQFFNF